MSNWSIVASEDEKWLCRLENCDEEHAQSVLTQLRDEPAVPDGLTLVEEGIDPEPIPHEPLLPEAVYVPLEPEPEPKQKRRFLRRKSG